MARPRKQGLDYFPHDTDAMSDQKIEILRALHGNNAYVFYFGMLERIYREASFEYDVSDAETRQYLSKKFGITLDEFDLMLVTAMKYGCFDADAYEKRRVLTSDGIKKRAGVVVEKRLRMQEKHAQKVSATETTQEIHAEMPQSKVKKSKDINTPYIPQQGDEAGENGRPKTPRKAPRPSEETENFQTFWACYPRKVGKVDAVKAWGKINPNAELYGKIIKGLSLAKLSEQWTREGVRFVPHPATWLYRRGWEDEYGAAQQTKTSRFEGVKT